MFKVLENKMLLILISTLVLVGSSMRISIPSIIEKILKIDIVKVLLMMGVLYIGKINIKYALIAAIIFIILNDKLNDTEIENFSSKL